MNEQLVGKKITLIAADVEVTKKLNNVSKDTNAQWTLNAQQNIRDIFAALFNKSNYIYQPQSVLTNRNVIEFIANQRIIEKSILSNFQFPLPSKNDLVWSLGADSLLLKNVASADYGLFVFLRAGFVEGNNTADYQSGIISVVDLNTGRTVWFNAQTNLPGDLRHPIKSLQTLFTLFERFPGVSQSLQ